MGNMYLSTRYPVKSPSYRYFYINAHDRLIHVHARYADYDFWYDLARFNPAPLLCLSQARTWISSIICYGHFFCAQGVKVRKKKGDGKFPIKKIQLADFDRGGRVRGNKLILNFGQILFKTSLYNISGVHMYW
jgi:hypothetical protein